MTKTRPQVSVLLSAAIFLIACGPSEITQQDQYARNTIQSPGNQPTSEVDDKEWLTYESSIVELEGRLVIKTYFGPPNFGENAETDTKERCWIVTLNRPINVRGITSTDPGLNTTLEDVRELQLVLSKPRRDLIGKMVIIKGTLFKAQTGHHFTDVLMSVETIGAISTPEVMHKWSPATLRGLVMGRSSKADAIRQFGDPKWEGFPEGDPPQTERWLEYESVELMNETGRLTVHCRTSDGVVVQIEFSPREMSESEFERVYGEGFRPVRYAFDPCQKANGGSATIYQKNDGDLEFYENRRLGIAFTTNDEDKPRIENIMFMSGPIGATRSACGGKTAK